ncbi:LysR family transcriptional regulator [Ramlibacter sp.]|uniref:LysR family transcriptional regulator n=1 Tax=Ramlibacter sp. TaxID=1917967 RepID=UPI003D106FF6
MPAPRPVATVFPRWKTFVKVATLGSLTRAAAALDVHQSAISAQIAALEEECGGRLFNRTGRGVKLTELGARVLPQVQALLQQADQFSDDILANGSVPRGDVTVGVVASTARPLIRVLFQRTRERFPGIRLNVVEGFSGNLDEWLASGLIDVGVLHRYGTTLGPSEQRLAMGETYLVGRTGEPLCEASEVEFARLDRVPLALPANPSSMRSLAEQIARRASVSLDVAFETNSLHLMKDIVINGGVYALLPFQAVFAEVQAGVLRASRVVGPSIERTVALGTRKHQPLSLAAREIATLLAEIATGLIDSGDWDPRALAPAGAPT